MNTVSSFTGLQRSSAALARAAFVAAILAGCGGGGTDSSGEGSSTPLTLSGTAASGAAISGGTIEVKCAAGNTSGTTQADGKYAVTIPSGNWPCLVRVSAAGGGVLHSIAVGSGSAAIANITPVTELIVASLVGAGPAGYYTSFNSTVAATISSGAVIEAQVRIVALLKAAGIDLTALGDLITATLAAKTGTGPGDAYDLALDALASALAGSGTTLSTLTTAAANTRPGDATMAVASLPAELLLKRAAPTCAALRSATYRMVTPTRNAAMADQTSLAVFDATTMRITRADGSIGTYAANGACRFTDQGSGFSADVAVSQAGVLVGRYTRDNGATYRNFIGFPEQSHTLAELAGNWNTMGMAAAGAGFTGYAGSATLDAAGKLTVAATCRNDTTWAIDVCTPVSSELIGLASPLVVDNAGGFASIDAATQTVTGRLFAYRAGSGLLMLMSAGDDGGFDMWTQQRNYALPTVGAVTTSWNFDILANLGSAGATYERSNTIVSVDAAAGSYLRTQKTPGTNNDHPETLFVNNPRAGFLYRPAGSSTAIDGSLQNINEFTTLRLQSMGFSPGLLPRLRLFEFFVVQP
jgi:hypothetical protein